MKTKIIATGLSGLIGSRINKLLSDRYQFLNLSLPNFDILGYSALEKIFEKSPQTKIVLHLAAFTDVSKAWQERGDKKGTCFKVNVLGTRNVARACRKFGKYLIHVSTDFVFNGQKHSPYTEKDLPDPIEWYGQTKLLAEQEVQKNLEHWAIVRLAFPYRASFRLKPDLVRRIIKGLREKNLYPMFADQVTTPTFIDDFAWALKKFFKVQPSGIFHLVGSSSQSPYELARKVAQVFGLNQKLVKKGSLAEYQKSQRPGARPWHQHLTISNQKARKKLGIKMSTLSEGLLKIKSQLAK
jgi:dTDP-4-dehydrorhamnose reductase